MTEVRMKTLFRMHIHPNVWLGLSLEIVKDHSLFFFLFGFNLLYSSHCCCNLAEVPSVARGILKLELKQRTYKGDQNLIIPPDVT